MLPQTTETVDPALLQAEQRARGLMLARDYAGAAQEYLRLEASSPSRSKYGLHAAEAYIEGKQIEEARAILRRSKIPQSNPYLKPWKDILSARIALSNNHPDEALLALSGPYSSSVPEPLRRQIHSHRATAFYRQGGFLAAAQERVMLDALLNNETERKDNQQAIWEAVGHLQDPALTAQLRPEPDVLRGWVELALIANSQIRDPAAFSQSIGAWRGRFPDHPAATSILPALLETSTVLNRQPRQIALLLPLSGQYTSAAAAIRDGFLSAWYSDTNPDRPAVTVYDANPRNITAVYQTAIDEGADFVVGPLEKPAIDTLLKSRLLSVPTLTLNHADNTTIQDYKKTATFKGRHFYQFSLSPEDEANQIAERAWFDGYIRAWVLTPASAWGERVYRSFKQRWETLGGEVFTHRTYQDDARDYEAAARALFNGRGSQVAASYLEGDPNMASSLPLHTDFIFLAAFPRQARQIHPHLVIYNTMHLPIYSTSHIYSGSVAPDVDHDLNDIAFGDMPWILGSGHPSSKFSGTVRSHRPKNNELSRLYAFGIDAYFIIPELGRLEIQPAAYFDGETGTLRIEEDGRIHRQLKWARFSNGVPQLIDP